MDLVKWLQKQKKHHHHHHNDNDDDYTVDEVESVPKSRKHRSRSVDPSSAHYLAAQSINLAHHAAAPITSGSGPVVPIISGRKVTPPINHLNPTTTTTSQSRRRLSLSVTSNSSNVVVDPNAFVSIENEVAGKKRRKSRGMLSIFNYDNAEGMGSKSNFFSGRKSSSNHFSPSDDALVENVASVTDPLPVKEKSKKKKSGSRSLLNGDSGATNLTQKTQALGLPSLNHHSGNSRRHSVSVVINAPPFHTTTNTGTSPTTYNSRHRRRSQGVPTSYDYDETMMMRLRSRLDDEDDDDCDGSDGSPYIRPPIVVVTSQRRKYSLQYDYDVRCSFGIL